MYSMITYYTNYALLYINIILLFIITIIMVFVTIIFSSLYNNYYIDNNIYHYLQNCIFILGTLNKIVYLVCFLRYAYYMYLYVIIL